MHTNANKCGKLCESIRYLGWSFRSLLADTGSAQALEGVCMISVTNKTKTYTT